MTGSPSCNSQRPSLPSAQRRNSSDDILFSAVDTEGNQEMQARSQAALYAQLYGQTILPFRPLGSNGGLRGLLPTSTCSVGPHINNSPSLQAMLPFTLLCSIPRCCSACYQRCHDRLAGDFATLGSGRFETGRTRSSVVCGERDTCRRMGWSFGRVEHHGAVAQHHRAWTEGPRCAATCSGPSSP